MLACCCCLLAREALGLARVGGGCETVRFGHGCGESSQVGGGLSTLVFAIRVDRSLNNVKEEIECAWPWFSSAEKSIRSRPGGGAPSHYACCCCCLLGRPLGGPWTGSGGRGVRKGAFRAWMWGIVAGWWWVVHGRFCCLRRQSSEQCEGGIRMRVAMV